MLIASIYYRPEVYHNLSISGRRNDLRCLSKALLTYLAREFRKYRMNHTFGKSYEINQVLGEKI